MRAILLAGALVIAAGCMGDGTDEPTTTTPEADDDDAMPIEPEEVSVALHEEPSVGVPPRTLGIRPDTIELAVGSIYTLVVTNEGQRGHDLVIDELGVATDMLGGGESAEVEVRPTEPGEYTMYCSIGGDGPAGHRAQGMVGTVVVA